MELSKEQIQKNASIPNAEIEQDIADTEAEIANMTREAEAFALLGDRMSDFRRTARLNGIKERQEFIGKLRQILAARAGDGEPK